MKDNDGLLLYKEIMIKIFIKILSNPFSSLKKTIKRNNIF